jgi:methylated-DNA-[protein]-cysteine S-methyltransferase
MVHNNRMNTQFFTLFGTVFGDMSLLWRTEKEGTAVCRIFLPQKEKRMDEVIRETAPGAKRGMCPQIEEFASKIKGFLAGQDVSFDLDILRLEDCSTFQRKVLLAEAEIPRGWISTYGRISGHLGIPGGARAVGSALACNPFPIIIPCHRAIRGDGSIGGYQGGVKMKAELLRHEGVDVSPDCKVRTPRMYFI